MAGAFLDVRGFAGGTRDVSPRHRLRIQGEVGIPVVLPRGCSWGSGCFGGIKAPIFGARWTVLARPRDSDRPRPSVGVSWALLGQAAASHYDVLFPLMPVLDVALVMELGPEIELRR